MNVRSRRSAARISAVQALYQMDVTGADCDSILTEYLDHRLAGEFGEIGATEPDECLGAADPKLFRRIVRGAKDLEVEIETALNSRLHEDWPRDRLDPVLLAVFRAAGAELLVAPGTPRKVILSEFVNVAAAFGAPEREIAFANGVLEGIASELRPAMESES